MTLDLNTLVLALAALFFIAIVSVVGLALGYRLRSHLQGPRFSTDAEMIAQLAYGEES